MKKQRVSSTWLALGTVILLFAGFILVLWSVGLFDFSGTDPSAKIIAASLALVGVMITAVASIFGVLLKNSLDHRIADINEQAEQRLELEADRNAALAKDAEDRLKLEADRNAALAKDAENRLKLEAAIQAVGLLSTGEGKSVPLEQRAGALFVLVSLRQYELATVLTNKLLASNQIDASSASGVLNRALICWEEPSIQEQAIEVLGNHIDQMLTDNGKCEIPRCIMDWEPGLSDVAAKWAVIALGNLLAARPVREWNDRAMAAVIGALSLAWTTETRNRVKNASGGVLKAILPAIPDSGYIAYKRATVDLQKIRKEVSTLSFAHSWATAEVIERLGVWAEAEITS